MSKNEFPGNLYGPGGGDEITLNREPEIYGIMPRDNEGDFPYSRDFAMPEVPCRATECPSNQNDKCVMPSCIEINSHGVCRQYVKTMDLIHEKVKALSIMTKMDYAFCRAELERCGWDVSKTKERIMSMRAEVASCKKELERLGF